jgi:D-alanyl-D-alanine carboxypeptidase
MEEKNQLSEMDKELLEKQEMIEKLMEEVMDEELKKLLDDFSEIEISKTGFTNPAGRCLVLFVHKGDADYGIVILGLSSREQVQKTARRILNEAI